MFEQFEMAAPDPILGLAEAFQSDPRPHKINLSVGVYQDERGSTPILNCVKEAERRLCQTETTKSYLGIDGLPAFGRFAAELLLGSQHEIVQSGRFTTLQTPGGTGALRVAADLLKRKLPSAQVWVSKPTWVNHPQIFAAADRQVHHYPYIDSAGTGLDFDGLLACLRVLPIGDAVVLHGGCHNPTGIDPTLVQWRQIAAVLHERRLLPIVDFAYQGLGAGLDEDAAGLRAILQADSEALICSSYSKNFGLYSERVGALTIVAKSAAAAAAALSHAKSCVRVNYSNPPRHGGAIVATILADAELRAEWIAELAAMRQRIHAMRHRFVETMRAKAPQADFSFIARQQGMFSYSGLTPLQVDELRSQHAVYVVATGGRINVAGMTEQNLDALCTAIAAVL